MNKIRSASEVALKILEDGGWCKGRYSDGAKKCLTEAYREPLGRRAGDGVEFDSIGYIVGQDIGFMTEWNDKPRRRFPEVRKALLAAASLEMSNAD